ncbi:MAG: SDR family NAD(P)-dependent oxidoreductase [Methanomassiliicoccus sp.]|nr:SDR family NAD(P)-dependent oxidoreductase [Methanomassiliicoccus sp.]
MKGRTVAVTGATSGIGRATAEALSRMGASLILSGRSEKRLSAIGEDIGRETGSVPILLPADLSCMDEVRRLAAEIRRNASRLNVLINNAGTIVGDRRQTTDGHEYTFALDHLAPFLLTNLLLDLLISSAPSRIVTVSSSAHHFGRIHFDDIGMEHGYTPFMAYAQAKLANVLFTYELARRLGGTGVTANCLDPGPVRTRFGNEATGLLRIGLVVIRPFELSPSRGARTSIFLASSPEVADVTGRYFVRRRPRRSSSSSYDREVARRLWAISADLAGLDGRPGPERSKHL